ncbi:MAG: DUF4326 domain-containing protein [Caldilineaceae bacterium]|nr:DUF4326 domain-containing protein [Caldilineaceae bacterium]
MAHRIQRRRSRGWRKPEGAVIVTRPTRWGNPFELGTFDRVTAIALYKARLLQMHAETPAAYRAHLEPLIGKDLVCWCGLNDACHADVLLELADELDRQLAMELGAHWPRMPALEGADIFLEKHGPPSGQER